MKAFIAVICFSLFINYSKCAQPVDIINDLMETSKHGHEDEVANKEKRCHDPLHLQLPLYDNLLGSARNLRVLRRDASDSCEKCMKKNVCRNTSCKLCKNICDKESKRSADQTVQLTSRFNHPEPEEIGLSAEQERYYTVGSFTAGPKQQILAKLLNVPENVQLERLIVLAKNKSKNKPSAIPHPVVIDTAHVFTTNDGRPAEFDLELHNVRGDSEDISNLTRQLNKELDAAIDTKKMKLGDSHLTPQEIDKIIEHVVEQMKKPKVDTHNAKEMVGNQIDTKLRDSNSELDDNSEGIKKKKSKKGSKKHGFFAGDEEVGGAAVETTTKQIENRHLEDEHEQIVGDKLHEQSEISGKPEEDDSRLGTFIIDKKGYGGGYGKKGKLFNLKGKKGKGKGYYRENDDDEEEVKDETVGLEHNMNMMENEEKEDAVLGTKKFKGKKGYGKKGKGYYREGDEENDEELDAGDEHPLESNFRSYQQKQQQQQNFPSPYQQANQYVPGGHQQEYSGNQQAYDGPMEPLDEYAYPGVEQEAEPEVYEPEMETYHGTGAQYQPPQVANHYQQPQQVPQQPQVQYHQPPVAYHPPGQPQQQHQAAYSNSKIYKSAEPDVPGPEVTEPEVTEPEVTEPEVTSSTEKVISTTIPTTTLKSTPSTESVLGAVKDQKTNPEDPKQSANWFENEYHKLRQWISDNVPGGEHQKTSPETSTARKSNTDEDDKEELVNKFTKVIEKDLTDGKKLTFLEKKNLDRKIAKMVRDNLNSDDDKAAEEKSRKKLDKLEELVEEEADEANLGATPPPLDEFKTRFSDNEKDNKKKVVTLKEKLRSSLDKLNSDLALGDNKLKLDEVEPKQHKLRPLKPLLPVAGSSPSEGRKPILGLRHLIPQMGQRSGMDTDTEQPLVGQSEPKTTLNEDDVGCMEDLKEEIKEKLGKYDTPEWYVEPPHYDHHHHSGEYDQYRSSDKKTPPNPLMKNLDKLLHPLQHKKYADDRSGEALPTLPEIIKDLEEHLNLPTLPPLPAMRQNNRPHRPRPQEPNPKFTLNGEDFIPPSPERLDIAPVATLPENRKLNPPLFKGRNFPQEQFAPQQEFPQQFRGQFQEFQRPMERNGMGQFVGAAAPPPPQHQQDHRHDLSHFGKIVPEGLHDMHLRDVSEQMKKHRMYFVGDGIKLPLHMHRHEDGTLHLSVDLQKLCKCNATDCKGAAKLAEPDFLSTNVLGAKTPSTPDGSDTEMAMDIGDAPLQMGTPAHLADASAEDVRDDDSKRVAKRSPRFNYYGDVQPQAADEKFDHLSPIKSAYEKDLQRKINAFNNDIKEYYANEHKGGAHDGEDKRVGLLTNILSWMKDIVVEDQ